MAQVSIIMPAWKFGSLDNFHEFFGENYAHQQESIEYFELIPVNFESLPRLKNFAVKFKGSEFNLVNIENLLQENRMLKIQNEKSKETIKALSSEFSQIVQNPSLSKDDQHKALRRAKKLKQLDEDNKKLRQLLRNQLENSEKLRLETQMTIETLKDEFELLVRELGHMQKKNVDNLQATLQKGKAALELDKNLAEMESKILNKIKSPIKDFSYDAEEIE